MGDTGGAEWTTWTDLRSVETPKFGTLSGLHERPSNYSLRALLRRV